MFGDQWLCPCGFQNFHLRTRCRNCSEPKLPDDPLFPFPAIIEDNAKGHEDMTTINDAGNIGPVQQEWVLQIPLMQQSVLFAAIRAPDGIRKNHPVKVLMRWFRRCVLLSAFDRKALTDPFSPGGGSFTGPFTKEHARKYLEIWPGSPIDLREAFNSMRGVYLEHVDELPHHFQLHFMHAAQIIGVHHSDAHIREWWKMFYLMIVNDAHLHAETDDEMNLRLSDNPGEWKRREVVTAS